MFCLSLVSAVPSLGCECGPPGHASQYIKEASVAFVGSVVFTNDDGSGKFTQKTLVRFEVEEAFKGLGPEVHEIWVDPGSFTSCYAEYHIGERYLVFGYGGAVLPQDRSAVSIAAGESKTKPTPPRINLKSPPKVYFAPECSGTRLITPKEKNAVSGELKYLRKYKEIAAKEQNHSWLVNAEAIRALARAAADRRKCGAAAWHLRSVPSQ